MPERFSDSQYSSLFSVIKTTFAQTVSEYKKSDATKATPQYNINKGLRIFGRYGLRAVMSEIEENLIGQDVIEPLRTRDITREVKLRVLNYLMKNKRIRLYRREKTTKVYI